jgi:hypothetical protein
MNDSEKALEWWETKIGNCVTPQGIWPIVKSLLKSDGPRAPIAIHGPLGLKFLPLEKANIISDCLENQFTPHDLCDENHEWRVEAKSPTSAGSCRQQPPWKNTTM